MVLLENGGQALTVQKTQTVPICFLKCCVSRSKLSATTPVPGLPAAAMLTPVMVMGSET